MHREVPLIEVMGSEILPKLKVSITIQEATHFVKNDIMHAKGKYEVKEVFKDDNIHLESFDKIEIRG